MTLHTQPFGGLCRVFLCLFNKHKLALAVLGASQSGCLPSATEAALPRACAWQSEGRR
jgi:hypothetical protein